MAKSKATGPLPSQLLDPPASKDADAEAEDEIDPSDPDDDAAEADVDDPLERRVDPVAPAKGAVQGFRPLGPPQPFRPIAPAQGPGGSPSIQASIPGFPNAFRGQQPAQAPAAQPSQDDQQARPGAPRAISDEQLTRNLLTDYADDLLVSLKVWRVMPAGPSVEVGTLEHILASKARHATNFIDVQGEWVIDFYRSKDGKPLSKSKHVYTHGPDYYEGWKPHLIGGEMDNQQALKSVADFLKAMNIQMPTALLQQPSGQQGTIGVPTSVYNGDVERMREDVRELKAERTTLLTKLEAKAEQLAAANSEIATLKMRVEILASRPQEVQRGDSDLVVLAKAFSEMGKKDKGDDSMWMTLMTMQQNHSKEMMELLSRRGGDAQMDRINSAWTTLFEGAKKMADVNKPNETADIAKALAPLGVAWLTGQQQMQMKQMELKAAAQGTQAKQQPAQQQAPAPAQAEPPPDPNAKRLAHKAEVFDAQMGMILHRASSGADPSAIGDELALAVRTVIYQELAEGHEQHQKMIKMLLEDPLASVTELAKATGRDEGYAKTVADRFMAKFRELMSQPQPNATPPQPQTVAAAPAPVPVVPPTPAQASATGQPGPVASPAAGPGSVASGDGKPQGAEAGVVAKGNGSSNHGDVDGGGQAAGGVDGADHPDVSSQPS